MTRKYWKKGKKQFLFIVIGIVLEVLVFNCRALLSLPASNQQLEYTRDGNMLYAGGMEGKPNYLYVGVNAYTEEGEAVPVKLTLMLQDEGHADYYELSPITIYPLIEKSKYLSIHSYGEVEGMRIYLEANSEAAIQVTDMIYDAKVPWFVSLPRILAVFAGLNLIWLLRPGSGIYAWRWSV